MVFTALIVTLISVWTCLWSIHRLSAWATNWLRLHVLSSEVTAYPKQSFIGELSIAEYREAPWPSSRYASLETAAFNSFFYTLGRRHRRFLRAWFSVGIGFAFCGAIAIIGMLLLDVSRGLRSSPPASPRFIVPVVPGVNLPWRHLGYLTLATLVSMGVHEAGHALAAASEGVRTQRVALFVALLFPGALVVLDSEAMDVLRPWQALRVYTAGVWHNAALCAFCAALLASLPLLLLPAFTRGLGLTVTSVPPLSPLHGHVRPGDTLTALNGHGVVGGRDWMDLLAAEASSVQDADTWQLSLAPEEDVLRAPGYCWAAEGLEHRNRSARCPPGTLLFKEAVAQPGVSGGGGGGRSVCLRASLAASGSPCDSKGGALCGDTALSCVYPSLPRGVTLFRIGFLAAPCPGGEGGGVGSRCGLEEFVLFAGSPAALGMAIALSDYAPRGFIRSLPGPLGGLLLHAPGVAEVAVGFTCQVSAALALLNLAPVFFLDGEAVLHVLFALLFPRWLLRTRLRICTALLVGGSLVLLLGLFQGLYGLL